MRVLIYEPNVILADALVGLLIDNGHVPAVAHSPDRTLTLMEEFRPDCLVLEYWPAAQEAVTKIVTYFHSFYVHPVKKLVVYTDLTDMHAIKTELGADCVINRMLDIVRLCEILQ